MPSHSRRRVWLAAALAAVVAFIGCQKKLPTGPSDLNAGVIVYQHANYLGESAHLTRSIADLKDFKGPCERFETSGGGSGTPVSTTVHYEWNDCISSIRVAPGWRVRVFRDDDYSGQSFETGEDVPNLQVVPGSCDHDGMNDCVTSVRLFSPDGRVAFRADDVPLRPTNIRRIRDESTAAAHRPRKPAIAVQTALESRFLPHILRPRRAPGATMQLWADLRSD